MCEILMRKEIFNMRHILNVRHSFELWRIMQLSKNKHPYQLIYFLLTQKKHSLCVIRCIFFKYAQTQICVNQLSELCFGSGTLIWIFGNSLLSKNVTRKYFMKSFKEYIFFIYNAWCFEKYLFNGQTKRMLKLSCFNW